MNLKKLLGLLRIPPLKIKNFKNVEIKGVTEDSRLVKKDFLFVAIRGESSDGHMFIQDALHKGASAVAVEKNGPDSLPVIYFENTRRALADIAAAFYQRPAEKLTIVGVTGTNGKTTTTYFLESIARHLKYSTGVIGTIAYRIKNKEIKSDLTTPSPVKLHAIFRDMVKEKIEKVFMEVSSHSLDQDRVWGINFDAGIFTNISRDHLDYHKTMENYIKAKAKLFKSLAEEAIAIVNADDPHWQEFVKETKARVVTYGVKSGQVRAYDIQTSFSGTVFKIKWKGKEYTVKLNLPCTHNVYNALAAACYFLEKGEDPQAVMEGLAELKKVPGRFEILLTEPFYVIVDYAHTPDALEKLLNAVKELKPEGVIAVFGAGGDRDRGKRPLMGKVAEQLSDRIVITNDNPRTEDPNRIIEDILKGISKKEDVLVIPDRKEAIKKAIGMAKAGWAVVLAGKGHEDYQIIGTKKIPFSDQQEAINALREKGVEI